jgi:hypothetical protein
MENINYKKLANNLLDFMIDNFELVEVVEILIGNGFTYDEVLTLGFEQETIEQAQERINKGLCK